MHFSECSLFCMFMQLICQLTNSQYVPLEENVIITIAGNGTAGSSGDNGLATLATLNNPQYLWGDTDGNLYVADKYNHKIRKIVYATALIVTFCGNGSVGVPTDSNGDGNYALDVTLNFPNHLWGDSVGNQYIADTSNQKIRKIAVDGIVSTIAGNGVVSTDSTAANGDNNLATLATLTYPHAVVGYQGKVYIADTYNNKIRIVETDGIIATFIGTGTAGYTFDVRTSALITQ